MRTGVLIICGVLATALVTPTLIRSAPVDEDAFTLARVVPDDVFLYVAERHNPERDFLCDYWGEVLDALAQSGVGGDVMELVGSLLGAEQTAELERLKERATQVLGGVDWEQLAAKETMFAQRFDTPTNILAERPPILVNSMVWVFRGSAEGAAGNYDGLVAILEAIVQEVNSATGAESLVVDFGTRAGAKVASVNLLRAAPGAPPLPLSVALRDDMVIIALRERLFNDVLDLMSGKSDGKTLGDDRRFKEGFAKLPPAEDVMTFFDVQALMEPLLGMLEGVVGIAGAPGDITKNTSMGSEARELHGQAIAAYQNGDFKKALALTRKAHEASPENSTNLYNMACFSALVGNKKEALEWLDKAVEGGFFAPRKIASDSDLKSLRGDPKFKATLARAGELSAQSSAEDVTLNAAKTGEVFRLRMQVQQAYQEEAYDRGLELAEQAYAIAPKDSMVLYTLARLHSVLGHESKGLDFLEQAVDAGFYCPRHMSKDTDLDSLRDHKRYKATLVKAQAKAGELTAEKEREKVGLVKRLIERFADAAGILEYTATVETTDGYSVRMESVAVLAADAKSRPIYPVFGKRPQLTDFDRYLPEETLSFSISGGFDIGELYKFLEDSVRLAGDKGEELLAKWNGVQKELGVNFREDIIGWIDGDSIEVTLEDGSTVTMIKVTDEKTAHEKVSAAIDFVAKQIPDMASKNPQLAMLAMVAIRSTPLEHEQLEGFQNLFIGMSPQPVAVWGTADGYLVFGSSASAVALCMATAKGDHPNIRSNEQAMNEAIVPSGPFMSVSLTDRRKLGEELATGIGIAAMATGMAGSFIPWPEVRPVLAKISSMLGKLSPVVRKIDFYKSAATHVTFDGQMWRTRTVTHYFSPAERAPAPSETSKE